jgi:hypothetical protein
VYNPLLKFDPFGSWFLATAKPLVYFLLRNHNPGIGYAVEALVIDRQPLWSKEPSSIQKEMRPFLKWTHLIFETLPLWLA